MKVVASLALMSCSVFAQQYRAPGGVVFANPSGFGNVAFPGTGRAPVASFPQALGAAVAGRQIPLRNGIGGRRSGIGYGGGYVSAYPVIVGGGYGGGYYDGGYEPQAPQPSITIVNNPPVQQAPTVILNQNFAPQAPPQPEGGEGETTHVFQPAPRVDPASDSAPAAVHYYLIAFKDHSVYSALAYWVEDKTMHYVTPQQTHNQASLDLIDMDFTKKLNQR